MSVTLNTWRGSISNCLLAKLKCESVTGCVVFQKAGILFWWLILIGHVRIHAYIRSPRNVRTKWRVCSYGHHLLQPASEQSNLSYAITRCATKSQIGTTAAHSKLVVAQLVPIHGNSCRLSSTKLLHGTVIHTYIHSSSLMSRVGQHERCRLDWEIVFVVLVVGLKQRILKICVSREWRLEIWSYLLIDI